MGISVTQVFQQIPAAAQRGSVKLGLYRFLKSSEGTLYDHSNGDYYPLYFYYHSVVQGWSEQASNLSLAALKTCQNIPRKQGKREKKYDLKSMHGTDNSKKTHLSIVMVVLLKKQQILS